MNKESLSTTSSNLYTNSDKEALLCKVPTGKIRESQVHPRLWQRTGFWFTNKLRLTSQSPCLHSCRESEWSFTSTDLIRSHTRSSPASNTLLVSAGLTVSCRGWSPAQDHSPSLSLPFPLPPPLLQSCLSGAPTSRWSFPAWWLFSPEFCESVPSFWWVIGSSVLNLFHMQVVYSH